MKNRLLAKIAIMMLLTVAARPAPGEAPASLTVAAVQFRSSSDQADNVARIQEHIRRAAVDGARVVVFPECALTSYATEAILATSAEALADAEHALAQTCREANVYAIVGTPTREGETLYNSAVVFTPQGTVLERYHKIQLAEDWPVGGSQMSVFPIDGVPCSIIICHDERYPELVRLPVLAGAQVVFYISNESGLRYEEKIEPYRAQIRARAVENSVFVVHANAPANLDLTDRSASHGHSRLIAPDGNLIGEEASIFGEDVLTATLKLGQATRRMALKSIERGPLADWWREGVRTVHIVTGE
jgi:predicted amidohydrolase